MSAKNWLKFNFCLFIFICPNLLNATPFIGLHSTLGTYTKGDSFHVTVEVNGIQDLYAYELSLVFTPNILSATTVSEGPFLAIGGDTLFSSGVIDNSLGSIT